MTAAPVTAYTRSAYEAGHHPALPETGGPAEFLQRVADGLGEPRRDLVHADADMHVGDAGALGAASEASSADSRSTTSARQRSTVSMSDGRPA
jgi:hypothetical protein